MHVRAPASHSASAVAHSRTLHASHTARESHRSACADAAEMHALRAQAFSLAEAYSVDPWRVHLALASAAITYCPRTLPLSPPETQSPVGFLPDVVAAEAAVLLQRPDHLLWVLLAWVVPGLSQDSAPQWALLLSLLADTVRALLHLPPAPAAVHALEQLQRFVGAAAHTDAAAILQPLLATQIADAVAPLLPLASRPALVSADSLLWPGPYDAAAALYETLNLRNAGRVRRLFSLWPPPTHAPLTSPPASLPPALASQSSSPMTPATPEAPAARGSFALGLTSGAGGGGGGASGGGWALPEGYEPPYALSKATVEFMTLLKLLTESYADAEAPRGGARAESDDGMDADLVQVRVTLLCFHHVSKFPAGCRTPGGSPHC